MHKTTDVGCKYSEGTVRPRGVESAEVTEVIKTKALMGRGIEGDPVRIVVEYWDFEGNKLAEYDPVKEETK